MARRKGCGLKQPKGYPKPPRTPRQPKIKKMKVPAALKAPKPPKPPKMSSHEKLYAAEARKRNSASNKTIRVRNSSQYDSDQSDIDDMLYGMLKLFLYFMLFVYIVDLFQ